VTLPAPLLEVRLEVRPRSPFRLPSHGTMDGLLRVRGGVLHLLDAQLGGLPVARLGAEQHPVTRRLGDPHADRLIARVHETMQHSPPYAQQPIHGAVAREAERRARAQRSVPRRAVDLLPIVGTRTFLVDVHLIAKPTE
jgi:hypothetical protein